jgi:hypothetical protein
MNRTILAAPVLLLALAGCTASPAQSPPASSAPAATVTTTAAAVPGGAVSPAAEAVSAWYSGGGKAALGKLITALGQAGAASPEDFPAMSAACAQVSAAVTAMDDAGPVPYAPAERWMARALAQFSAGSADCQAGVQGSDVSLLQKSAAAINAGSADLVRATKAIQSLG